MRTPLHIVPPTEASPEPRPETLGAKVRRLQAEARQLANDHTGALLLALAEVKALADEINAGGDAYPAGIRSIARDVSRGCERNGLNINAIMERVS